MRLPYLKSMNQVANNQQGTANLGYSLAFGTDLGGGFLGGMNFALLRGVGSGTTLDYVQARDDYVGFHAAGKEFRLVNLGNPLAYEADAFAYLGKATPYYAQVYGPAAGVLQPDAKPVP